MIRESLLDSERYWHCTIEARELFFHLMLLADDFGCVSLAPVMLKRRCFENQPTPEKLASLLGQLIDHDLVRRYEQDGASYGFLPRFNQRLQRFTLKHPKPPEAIYYDDAHAIKLFNIIKDGRKQATDGEMLANVGQPMDNGLSTVGQPMANGLPTNEVKRSEEKGSEEKRSEVKGSEGELNRTEVELKRIEEKGRRGLAEVAQSLGLTPRPGEQMEDFKTRVKNAIYNTHKPKPEDES
jgi:hypothetical protein